MVVSKFLISYPVIYQIRVAPAFTSIQEENSYIPYIAPVFPQKRLKKEAPHIWC
jgi:hypothetical protein